jgi:1-acyl-sn-glycerol-3-phosphate acyltransferase
MLYKIGRAFFAFLFKGWCGLEVLGQENIPRKGGFILASNHMSYLDPEVLGVACPRVLNFMAKDELFKNRFFGKILRWVHAFPVKRDAADLSAIKDAMHRVRSGEAILLFPEGGRQYPGQIGKPEAGVGFLSAKLGVPVIPAFIRGTETVLPIGAKQLRRAKISVSFGKEIIVERRMAYSDIALRIMEAIRQLSCRESN